MKNFGKKHTLWICLWICAAIISILLISGVPVSAATLSYSVNPSAGGFDFGGIISTTLIGAAVGIVVAVVAVLIRRLIDHNKNKKQ